MDIEDVHLKKVDEDEVMPLNHASTYVRGVYVPPANKEPYKPVLLQYKADSRGLWYLVIDANGVDLDDFAVKHWGYLTFTPIGLAIVVPRPLPFRHYTSVIYVSDNMHIDEYRRRWGQQPTATATATEQQRGDDGLQI